MRLRPAQDSDRDAMVAFLQRHEAASIFPLSGLAGRAPSAQDHWIAEDRGPGGPMQGVVALGRTGFLMPQWPGLDPIGVFGALQGRRIAALTGPSEQVAALLALLPSPPRRLSREPLCTLALDRMVLPDTNGLRLAPIGPADVETAIGFRMAFDIETLAQPAETARAKAEADVAGWRLADSHRLLWDRDQPVALTGVNARLPDVVLVGGVYVPPALRNHGLARRAVGLHLAELRQRGTRRAVLFAANAAALAAYRALGFVAQGFMSVAILKAAVVP